ncbi:MAG: STAS domain-containing protein [Candidatus Krumholzibacteriia bacterium]
MTADGTRPPILLIRPEGNLGGPIELHRLDPDGNEHLIARREGLGPDEDLETLVRVVALADHQIEDVVVDLAQVKWLNSVGLGWLVGLVRQRKLHGDTVALVGVNERIASLLHVTSLDLALPVHDSLAAAMQALRTDGPRSGGVA